MLTIGKPIGGGVPVGVYGMSQELAERMHADECETGAIGGTLAGNALSLAAVRATLGPGNK